MIYVGLGGNLGADGEIVARFRAARARLDARRSSALYRSAPVGLAGQPPFLNAVIELETAAAPRQVLEELLQIEAELGRVRVGPSGGPRTLDLDLLLVDALVIDEPDLVVPHPRLHQRAFVLRPLAELVGRDFTVPRVGGTVGELLDDSGDQAIERIAAGF